MEEVKQCPICGGEAKEVIDANDQSYYKYDCPFCGVFGISGDAIKTYSSRIKDSFGNPKVEGIVFSEEERGLLGGELRWAKIEGRKPFGEKDFVIQSTDLPKLLAKCPQNLTPADMLDLLLRYFAKKSPFKGSVHSIVRQDSFLVYTHIFSQYKFFIDTLITKGWAEKQAGSFRLTFKGWNAYYDLIRNRANSNRAFVAMWFNSDLEDIYEKGFRSALEDEEIGFEARRIDKVPQNDNQKLCDSILAEIRQAQIVVADFTGQRAGVYYEAGFAEGLSIPVIRTCRKDEEEQTKLHFDVNLYPFIFWKDSEDLRKKLKARILARIDKFRGKDRQFKPWEG